LLSGVSLRTSLLAAEDRVEVEGGELDRVLLNLILNAKDAVGEDGEIEVATENTSLEAGNPRGLPAGRYLALKVQDNGCGIPAELQARIFEPYFTTKPVGKGTGLGLSTVAAVVEKAGGHLSLTSRPGATSFEILLPMARQSRPPLVLGGERGTARVPRGSVLLVEDEPAIRALVQRLLERQGFRVTSLGNGGDATSLLREGGRFDLLVTDLMLPGASGREIACAFHRQQPEAPVLFMSGFPGDELPEKELRTCAKFLAKPFSQEKLADSLAELFGRAS
jgi:two-component system cell cycle sensor histidine kinase/response regulator CckA